MNDWYFFVLQAVVGNLRASRNLESISLSRGGGNKRERHVARDDGFLGTNKLKTFTLDVGICLVYFD